MATTLIFAEIVFYLTVSIAIILMAALGASVTYRLIRIARELEGLSRNLNQASSEAGERIREVVERLSDIPVLSFFLRRHQAPREKEKKPRVS